MKSKRSIRNLFVLPRFQLKLSLFYIVVGGLLISGTGVAILYKLSVVQELMNNSPMHNLEVQGQLNELMLQCIQISLLGFGVFIILSFLFALVSSHRIAGPQIAIKAYIDALKEGNYDYQRNLRATDELTEVMDALKELAPVLRERERMLKEHSKV